MAINKVVDRNNNVLIDLTNDTIKPEKVLAGVQFHDNAGNIKVGMVQPNEIDSLKYTFIDYDGEVLYKFTDEEIDAMEELPVGPDHTDDNLTFQEWNWTLEELKNWDRTRPDRPIVGANLITSDEKTYFTIETTKDNKPVSLILNSSDYRITIGVEIDWGDGTIEEHSTNNGYGGITVKHTYEHPLTEYTIVLNPKENADYFLLGATSNYGTPSDYYSDCKILDIKLGKFTLPYNSKTRINFSKAINFPANLSMYNNPENLFSESPNLRAVVWPRSLKKMTQYQFAYASLLKTVSLPATIEEMKSEVFYNGYSLEYMIFPDSLKTSGTNWLANAPLKTICIRNNLPGIYELKRIESAEVACVNSSMFSSARSLTNITLLNPPNIGSNAFQYCTGLRYLKFPDSITSIGSRAFSSMSYCTFDFSEQTKVINLQSDPAFTQYSKILIPSNLLDQYKSAAYWSNYADYMVGV